MTQHEPTWSKRITEWQVATFGEVTPAKALERAEEEWEELALEASDYDPVDFTTGANDLAEEAADVVITLAAFVRTLGFDLAEVVEAKMVKNRARKWRVQADGKGYHVKEGES